MSGDISQETRCWNYSRQQFPDTRYCHRETPKNLVYWSACGSSRGQENNKRDNMSVLAYGIAFNRWRTITIGEEVLHIKINEVSGKWSMYMHSDKPIVITKTPDDVIQSFDDGRQNEGRSIVHHDIPYKTGTFDKGMGSKS